MNNAINQALIFLFGRADRQCKHKTCSLLIVAVYPYLASQLRDNQPGDGEPQSCALHIFIEFHETLEHVFVFFGGNAASRVGN